MTGRTWYRVMVALLAVSLAVGLAACGSSKKSSSSSSTATTGSSNAGGQPGKGKPAVTLGAKNFTEEYILGQLYAQALQAKGYTVNLKNNIGSTEIIDKALTSGKIDAYADYTGTILETLAHQSKTPKTATETYSKARAFQETRGFTMLAQSPGADADANVTKPSFATKNGLKTTADLKKLKSWTFGGPPENRTRFLGVVGLKQVYGLNNLKFVPLAIGLRYQALDSGKVDVIAGFTTEGQLADKSKYIVLPDPKGLYGFQNIAPIVNKKKLAAWGPAFSQTMNAVTSKLTNEALQKMNAAVDLNKQKPAEVAKQFLQANGLL